MSRIPGMTLFVAVSFCSLHRRCAFDLHLSQSLLVTIINDSRKDCKRAVIVSNYWYVIASLFIQLLQVNDTATQYLPAATRHDTIILKDLPHNEVQSVALHQIEVQQILFR